MFINHIALQWYYRILNLLKEHGLNKQHSPNDLLTMLSEVKKVKINQIWFDAERTKKVSGIMKKLKLYLLCKIGDGIAITAIFA